VMTAPAPLVRAGGRRTLRCTPGRRARRGPVSAQLEGRRRGRDVSHCNSQGSRQGPSGAASSQGCRAYPTGGVGCSALPVARVAR
jgi:hypothetical protein